MRWTFEISEVRPGMGFFALKGEKFDGHALIPAALAAGAADVIDGQEELQRRAREYRRTLKASNSMNLASVLDGPLKMQRMKEIC